MHCSVASRAMNSLLSCANLCIDANWLIYPFLQQNQTWNCAVFMIVECPGVVLHREGAKRAKVCNQQGLILKKAPRTVRVVYEKKNVCTIYFNMVSKCLKRKKVNYYLWNAMKTMGFTSLTSMLVASASREFSVSSLTTLITDVMTWELDSSLTVFGGSWCIFLQFKSARKINNKVT